MLKSNFVVENMLGVLLLFKISRNLIKFKPFKTSCERILFSIRIGFFSKNVLSIYYLQHERPCCISIYKLEPKARVVYLIQHGREFCKWLVKLSNFIDQFAK